MNELLFLPESDAPKMATQQDGIRLCELIHKNIEGAFPALTGGLLYKEGNRKDIDIVLYRHRQDCDPGETDEFTVALSTIGVEIIKCFGFVTKAKWNGFDVDIFNPETSITELEHLYGDQE